MSSTTVPVTWRCMRSTSKATSVKLLDLTDTDSEFFPVASAVATGDMYVISGSSSFRFSPSNEPREGLN